jgi:hypothetical protein
MAGIARELGHMPLILRCTVVGSASLCVVVAGVALVGALVEYPSTAWFAVLEGGFIGGIVGGVVGFLAGMAAYVLATVTRRIRRHGQYSSDSPSRRR